MTANEKNVGKIEDNALVYAHNADCVGGCACGNDDNKRKAFEPRHDSIVKSGGE